MLDENEVRARLEREGIPNVDHFEVTTGPDHTGAEAAFICIVIPDSIAELDDFSPYTRAINNRIFDVFKENFPGYWPYTSFQSVSETLAIAEKSPPRRNHVPLFKVRTNGFYSALSEEEVKTRLELEGIPNVDGYQVSIREDSTGDVAAFIFVTLPDALASRADYFEQTKMIDDKIFNVFDQEFQGYWPYVRFRSASQMAAR